MLGKCTAFADVVLRVFLSKEIVNFENIRINITSSVNYTYNIRRVAKK